MMEPEDTVPEQVSIEMEARPSATVAKDSATGSSLSSTVNATDEKPPTPPKRDYSIVTTEDKKASVQKRKTIVSFPKPHFVYKQEDSKGWMSCLKIILIVFNLFIWALGAAITALGIWVKADDEFWKIQNNLDVEQFTTGAWVLIFIGVIIMIIGFIGCYGVIASQICFLLIFSIIVGIVIIMEIVVMALVWATVSNKNVQEDIKLKAKRAMGEMMKDDKKREFIDLLQAKLKCCGVDGPGDYSINPNNVVPIPPSCIDENQGVAYKNGCYNTVMDYLKGKAAVVGGVSVAIFLLQLAVLVFTICMMCGLKQAGNTFI